MKRLLITLLLAPLSATAQYGLQKQLTGKLDVAVMNAYIQAINDSLARQRANAAATYMLKGAIFIRPADTLHKWMPWGTVIPPALDTLHKWLPWGTVIPPAGITQTAADARYVRTESQSLSLVGGVLSITGGNSVTIGTQPVMKTGTISLPAVAVGNGTAVITLSGTMPNTSYIVLSEVSGNVTLLGGLSVKGVLSRTTTSVTLHIQNTSALPLSAGGVINVYAISY